jgi:hypothetical protein
MRVYSFVCYVIQNLHDDLNYCTVENLHDNLKHCSFLLPHLKPTPARCVYLGLEHGVTATRALVLGGERKRQTDAREIGRAVGTLRDHQRAEDESNKKTG